MTKSKSQTSNFLKKKERYDPKKALETGTGKVSSKGIEKKRVLSKNRKGG